MPTTTDDDRPAVRIGTWNVEWAGADSKRGIRVAAALKKPECDIVCVTEGRADILPSGGLVIDAGQDWGNSNEEAGRKVLVWSRRPWSTIDMGLHMDASRWQGPIGCAAGMRRGVPQ